MFHYTKVYTPILLIVHHQRIIETSRLSKYVFKNGTRGVDMGHKIKRNNFNIENRTVHRVIGQP